MNPRRKSAIARWPTLIIKRFGLRIQEHDRPHLSDAPTGAIILKKRHPARLLAQEAQTITFSNHGLLS
jgi:hypothetical protein